MTRCFRVKEILFCLACQTSVPVSSPFSLFSCGGSHIVEYSNRVSDAFVNVFTHTVSCIFVKVRSTNNEKVNMFGFSHLL